MSEAHGIETEGLLVEATNPQGEQEIPPEVLERIDQITQSTAEEVRIALLKNTSAQKELILRQFQIHNTARLERRLLRQAIEASESKTLPAVFLSNVERSLLKDEIVMEKKGPQGKGKTTAQLDTQILTLRSPGFTTTNRIPEELEDFHRRAKAAIDSIEDTEIKSLLVKLMGKYLGEAIAIDPQLLEKANEALKKIGIFIDQRRGIAILRPTGENSLQLPTCTRLTNDKIEATGTSAPEKALEKERILETEIEDLRSRVEELEAARKADAKELESAGARIKELEAQLAQALKYLDEATAPPKAPISPATAPALTPARFGTKEELNRFIMNSLIQGMNGSEITVKTVNDLIEALQGGIYDDPAIRRLANNYLVKLRSARATAQKGKITNRYTNELLGGV